MTPTDNGWMRLGVACGVAIAAGVVAGCAGAPGPPAAADCSSQVRMDGRVYTSHGYSDRDATRAGVADLAECQDTGSDPGGSVFPDDPEQVPVWTFPGYPAEDVVGVRSDRDSLAVFVADSLSRAESERILAELSRP